MLARGVQEFSCYRAGDFNFLWYAKRYQSKSPCSFESLHNFSVMSCAVTHQKCLELYILPISFKEIE